jgi:hypothetical protein
MCYTQCFFFQPVCLPVSNLYVLANLSELKGHTSTSAFWLRSSNMFLYIKIHTTTRINKHCLAYQSDKNCHCHKPLGHDNSICQTFLQKRYYANPCHWSFSYILVFEYVTVMSALIFMPVANVLFNIWGET